MNQQEIERLDITLFPSLCQEPGKEVYVQLRCRVSEPALLRKICSNAYHGRQVVVFFSFKDKAQALNTLQQHGLIIPEPDGKGGTKFKWVP